MAADTPLRVPCTVMHSGLFPPSPLDPFNPPRIRAIAQIEADKLLLISPLSRRQPTTLGTETLRASDDVILQRLSATTQRLEILRKSAMRYPVVVLLLFIYFAVFRSRDLGYSMLIALVGAVVSPPLFFVLNGGLTVEGEVARFSFTPREGRKRFYVEVEPTCEAGLRDALSSAGVKLVDRAVS